METNMALKETNKNRSKVEDEVQQDQHHEIDNDTCGYVTTLVLGPLLIIGGLLLIINAWILPNL
jgi:hypothetical protein